MTHTLVEAAWPFYGYAPGNYSCQCFKCHKQFDDGDKRAIVCLECAVIQAKKHIADAEATRSHPVVEPTQLGDSIAEEMRAFYEANKGTRHVEGEADNLMLGLLNIVLTRRAAIQAMPTDGELREALVDKRQIAHLIRTVVGCSKELADMAAQEIDAALSKHLDGPRDEAVDFEGWWQTYKHRNREKADYSLKKQIAFDAWFARSKLPNPPCDEKGEG